MGQGKSVRLSWPLRVRLTLGLTLLGGELMAALSQDSSSAGRVQAHVPASYHLAEKTLFFFLIRKDLRGLCAGLTMRASSRKTGVRSAAAYPGGLLQRPGQVICQKPLPTLGGWALALLLPY